MTDGRQYHAGDDMDARARVKRLEAECERLREQAEEMAKRQAITQYWLDRSNNTISAMSLETALATPPLGELVEQLPENHRARLEYEEVRRLPEQWENATDGMTDSATAAYGMCARELRHTLETAFTAAPAVPSLSRDWWRALEQMASQTPTHEMSEDDREEGDFEGAFDIMVDQARRLWREIDSAPAGEVVVTTNEDGECVSVTRQDSEGQILSVIWERESAPADGWWKKGDHVEFVTDEITDKGPCTGKIRWVLDGLACIELADDFVHVRWSEIGNFRMARHHRTGWPLWIVGESAAAPQRGGE